MISRDGLKLLVVLTISVLLPSGCIKPKITVFPESTEPLQEFTLKGEGKGKVLLIPVKGFISESPTKEMFVFQKASVVQEVVSHLRKAEKDKEIKALLLKVDSPGGTITASDMLYHEILGFKTRTKAKVVVAMMSVATSGGYYISLPADFIMAHPTTVTGSVGVLFIRPKVMGLMEKIGLDVEVDKSGKNKDMGSPFRMTTDEEKRMLQNLIESLGSRFVQLVAAQRKLDENAIAEVSTARVFLGEEALRLGLVDKIGYLDDAISQAKQLAGLPDDAKLVVYRRTENPNDTIYNNSTAKYAEGGLSLIDLGLSDAIGPLRSGFYYLWLPAAGSE